MSNQPPPYSEKGDHTQAPQAPYPTDNIQQMPYQAGNVGGAPYNQYPPQNPQYPGPNVVINQPYPPGAPQYGGTTIIQPQYTGVPTTVVYQANVHYTSLPQNMICPHCQCQVVTSIGYESGGLTWLLCFIIFLFVGILGCCLIPFCVNDCKDVHHYCPNCKAKLGIFRRL